MKRHNTIKVVLVTLLVFMLLSWILPAAYFSGSYADQGRVQMGLFDLFSYPTTAISYFGYIAIFIWEDEIKQHNFEEILLTKIKDIL